MLKKHCYCPYLPSALGKYVFFCFINLNFMNNVIRYSIKISTFAPKFDLYGRKEYKIRSRRCKTWSWKTS